MKKNNKFRIKVFNTKKVVILLLISTFAFGGVGSYLILKNKRVANADGLGNGVSTIPRTISNLVSVVSGTDDISLSWDNPFPVSERSNTDNGFRIERSLSANKDYSSLVSLAATENSYVDTTTSTDTVYYYRLCSFSQDNVSSYSNIATPERTEKKDSLAVDGDFEQSSVTSFFGASGWSGGGDVYYDDVAISSGSIANGGFESGFTSWNQVPDVGTISIENTLVKSGSSAAKLSLPIKNTSKLSRIESMVTVTAGNYYTLSFWSRTSDGVNAGRYAVLDISNGTTIITERSTGIFDTTYKQFSIKFKAPAGCSGILIKLFAPGENRGVSGKRKPGTDDTIGNMWTKLTDYSVLYDDDLAPVSDNSKFNIVDDPDKAGNHIQSMSVVKSADGVMPARFDGYGNFVQAWRTITHREDLASTTDIDESDGMSEFEPGQTYEFKIDKIYLGSNDQPASGSVSYDVYIGDSHIALSSLSTTPSSVSFSYTTPTNLSPDYLGRTIITIRICISLDGATGDFRPVLYFDGVHFYPKDTEGNYEALQVPAPRNHTQNTSMVFFTPKTMDPYDIASRYDQIMLGDPEYIYIPLLKKYNPNVKIFYYYSGSGVEETRHASTGQYIPYTISLVKEAFTAPEGGAEGERYADRWFAKYPDSALMPTKDIRLANDIPIEENYVVGVTYNPPSYEVNLQDPDYQSMLVPKMTDFLTTIKADGVFLDVMVDKKAYQDYDGTGEKLVFSQDSYGVQAFQNYVYPRIKAAGFEIMQNACARSMLTFPGNVYLNPTFKSTDLPNPGDADYVSSLDSPSNTRGNYIDNSAEIMPTYFFDEWAFFGRDETTGNYYNSTIAGVNRWEVSLRNLDEIVRVNNSIAVGQREKTTLTINGVDKPEDPAYGVTGWINFGLASYMLGKSEYSLIGFTTKNTRGEDIPLVVDYSRADQLGEPIEARNKHSELYADETLQTREYARGMVVVNGSPTASRNYTLTESALDENSNVLAAGSTITLPAHSGRILLFPADQRAITISNVKTVSYGSHYVLTGTKSANTRNIEAVFNNKKYYASTSSTTWSLELDTSSLGSKTVNVYDADFPTDTSEQVTISRRKIGDINGDGLVNSSDLVSLISSWNNEGSSSTSTSDFNEDGRVNQSDFSGMMFNWDQ